VAGLRRVGTVGDGTRLAFAVWHQGGWTSPQPQEVGGWVPPHMHVLVAQGAPARLRLGGRLLLTSLIWKLGTEGPCYWIIYMQSGPEGSGACIYNVMGDKRYEAYRRGVCKI
jgi:hypothetical protein